MKITSNDNRLVKHIKHLSQKKYREEYREYIVEGIKLCLEAINTKQNIKGIFVCTDILSNTSNGKEFLEQIENMEYYDVDKKIFDKFTEAITPQGVLMIIEKQEKQVETEKLVLILENIQDPGNLGTIIRTAEATGVDKVYLSKGCVDLYSNKVVRATMGSIFRVPIEQDVNIKEKLQKYKQQEYNIYVTILEDSISLYDNKFDDKSIIVIGNEANGVSEDVVGFATRKIKIPMYGEIESLNASVAASVILYEVMRQKI